jgi:flagellar biosynthetic protein FliR
MFALLELYLNHFLVFVFVLTRLSGMVMIVPVFGSRGAPMQVRALLAIGLSVIITPLHAHTPVDDPGNIVNLMVLMAREAGVGIALGLAILILFSGAQLAGQLLSQLSGMSIAEAFDPAFDSSVSSFTQLLDWVAMAIFVCIGGHRQVLAALLDTFQWMPPGQGSCSTGVVEALVDVMGQSFVIGVRAAAPAMIALLLAVLVTGLISRTLPQLNVMAIGFNINVFVLLGTLSVTLGAAAWVFQDQLDETLNGIVSVFSVTRPGS